MTPKKFSLIPGNISRFFILMVIVLLAIYLGARLGGIGIGFATGKASEAIARQPEAADKIRTNMMLGLVFIETAIIYALVVAILIIFVL